MKRLLFLLALVALLGAMPASAQTPTPNEINVIAKELWCPLCNGVRLDNCDLQACIQMREVISEKLETGASKQQIKDYFVQQYGDVVLGAPNTGSFGFVVWAFPILAAVVGLGWLVYFVSTTRRKAATQGVRRPAASSAANDDYLKRVEKELDDLD